jgi:hypothetical protein
MLVTACIKRRHGKLQAVSRKIEVIELRNGIVRMADGSGNQKAKVADAKIGSRRHHPRGRRARHVKKAKEVNVGDPNRSHKEGVLADKCKSKEAEKLIRKSEEA